MVGIYEFTPDCSGGVEDILGGCGLPDPGSTPGQSIYFGVRSTETNLQGLNRRKAENLLWWTWTSGEQLITKQGLKRS